MCSFDCSSSACFRSTQPLSLALHTVVLFSLLIFIVTAAGAQSDPALGILPFSTHVDGQYDSIDPATGNIVLSIPIMSKAGKIPFSFRVVGNFYTYALTYSGQTFWIGPNPGANFKTLTAVASGLASVLAYTMTSPLCNGVYNLEWRYSNLVLTDETGAEHPFSASFMSGPCGNSSGSSLAPDGSGYTLTGNTNSSPFFVVHDRSGNNLPLGGGNSAVPGNGLPGGTLVDPDGVTMSVTGSSNTYTYVDTLGQTAVTASVASIRGGSQASSAPDTYTYTDVNNHPQTVEVNYTPYPWRTSFGCSGIQDATGSMVYFPTSVVLSDGETFGLSYEATPGYAGDVTGRLAKLTLPTGGYITFTYSGGNNNTGIQCTKNAWGNMATLTRTMNDGKGHTTTWTFTSSASDAHNNFTTTQTDPVGNTVTYHFHQWLPTEKVVTDVNLGVLSTTTICYNGSNSSQSVCIAPQTTGAVYPVTQTDVYTSLGTASPSLVETQYNNYGETKVVKRWDLGAGYPPSGAAAFTTTTSYTNVGGVTCGTVGSYIYDRPCTVATTNSAGSTVAQTKYTYNSAGHATQTSKWVSGTTYLNSSATYNPNGTIATYTDSNNATTNLYYNGTGGCNNLLLTSAVLPMDNLTTSQTWNCVGGVLTSATDPNGQPTIYGFVDQNNAADPLWRRRSVTDPLNNKTWTTPSSGATLPATVETSLLFNSGGSTLDALITLDGLGRPYLNQTRQAPGSQNFDTVVTTYDATGRVSSIGLPCVSTASLSCSSSATTTTYDAMNRPLQTSDGGGGTQSTSYPINDVLGTLGPAPSGEHTKNRQLEYDGLGRLISVCEILSSGGSSCGQSTAASGYKTSYAYGTPTAGGSQKVVTQGVQARTYVYDGLGRLISETNPESGNRITTYVYDTDPACNFIGLTPASIGDLISKTDANGNKTCYSYDSLHRLTDVAVLHNGACFPPVKRFRYDNMSRGLLPSPSGYVASNIGRQMIEAWTGDCVWPTPSNGQDSATDEWFAYSPRSEMTDLWESASHVLGYFHGTASYAANGLPTSLGGVPGYTAVTYGLDGEGRLSSAQQGAAKIVCDSSCSAKSTTYDAGGRPIVINIAGDGDNDTYTYYSNTGRMHTFSFAVGAAPKALGGTLTWNPNGTLSTLAITDGFNAGGAQTCNFGSATTAGYDDLGRLLNANCGSAWSQTFSYNDQYGNITKSGSSSWMPGYDPTTNHALPPVTYDNNGNMTYDTFHNYAWYVDNKLASTDSTTCTIFGSSDGTCILYDAFGREVERGVNGIYTEVMYTPVGKTAIINGQMTTQSAYFPLAGGATLFETGTGGSNAYFWHKDSLGSVRLSSSLQNRSAYFNRAFAPYGEMYDNFGNTGGLSFTGDTQDSFTGLYDTPNRELSPSQGRWLSPDPAGLGAVDPSNPQSWNRYSYVNNQPLTNIDSLGLAPLGIPGCSPGTVCPGYTMDGQAVTKQQAFAFLMSGAAVECPNDACQGTNRYGLPTQFVATLEGTYFEPQLPGEWPTAGAAGEAAVGSQNGKSIALNKEIYGNMYMSANGNFSFRLGTVEGTASATFDPTAIPDDTQYAGFYHTHGAFDLGYYSEQFSGLDGDVGVALSPGNQNWPTYLGTPLGRIEVFDPPQFGASPWGCVLVGTAVTPGPGISTVPVPTCP